MVKRLTTDAPKDNIQTACDQLLFYIELSMNMGLLADNSAEYWSKMVHHDNPELVKEAET